MNNIRIETLVIGMVRTNCYVVDNTRLNEAIVIDPADESKKIVSYLKENGLTCKAILLTHGHFDHIMAAKKIVEYSGAKIYAHEKEAELVADPDKNASTYFHRNFCLTPDILFKDDEVINLAGFNIRVIHTPGHTIGGVCYHLPDYDILFSGDTLFHSSIGRHDFPTGNGSQLIDSIRDKLMVLKHDTKVYPGHGDLTTIGYERVNNLYI